MRITAAEQAAQLLASERPLAWCVGMLPDAPANAVCWLRPLTIGEAETYHAAAMIDRGTKYTPADGHRACIAGSVLVNPDELLLTGSEPAQVDQDSLLPLFEPTLECLGDIGDDMVSLGGALLGTVLDATGWRDPPEAEPFGIETYRRAVLHRGRWVDGILPWQPEAAFYVRPIDEATRAAALQAAGALGQPNPATVPIHALSECVRSGPGGEAILTPELVKSLPYGGALALYRTAEALTLPQGVGAAVRFRAVAQSDDRTASGRDGADVVDHREVAPASDGAGARAAATGDGGDPATCGDGATDR